MENGNEHISIVLDVGEHMGNNSAVLAIESLIQKKLFSESKDELALVFCGTSNTKNSLYKSGAESFQHISVVFELNKSSWDLLKLLKDESVKCENGQADLLEAVYVAAKCLVEKLKLFCFLSLNSLDIPNSNQKKIGRKRIILFSNFNTKIDMSSMDHIKQILNEEVIHVDVVFVNSDDKTSQLRLENENEIKALSDETQGNCFTFQDSLTDLNMFQMKETAQRGWKVDLEVSDVFTLSLIGYTKVKQVKPPSLKMIYGGDPDACIETKENFHLDNGEQTPIESDDIIKGFKYGKSIIPCTDEDIKSMKLEVKKSMKLIGFTEQEHVPRYLFVGDSSMFFVVDKDEHSNAFSSLVYAMYACQMVAIVRRVYSKASSPRLGLLIPRIKSDHVSLVYCEIAFGEDIRTYCFPNLLSDDHNLRDSQIKAVDSLIDHLMLIEPSDNNEDKKELYKTTKMRNPVIQYFYQCAQFRCLNPGISLPECSETLLSQLKPPKDKIDSIQPLIDEINKQFALKAKSDSGKKKTAAEIFSPDTTACKRQKILEKDVDSLNFGVLLDKKADFGLLDPIGDFRTLLEQNPATETVISLMEDRIWQLIRDSYKDTFYEKAVLCLYELRKQCIERSNDQHNFVSVFNAYLRRMKTDIKSMGSKNDFWKFIVQGNINLISETESKFSSVRSEIDSFLLEFDGDDIAGCKETISDDEMSALFDDM